MKLFHMELIKKKKLEVKTETRLGISADILLVQKLFLGTYYLMAVSGLFIAIIFLVIAFMSIPAGTQANLVVQSTNSVTLTWMAPGDDNNVGQAEVYDIRYSTSSITEDNWPSAIQASNPPDPQIAGSAETITITGLSPDTFYYFAIKTKDDADNWSALSNIATKKTAAPELCETNWSCTAWSDCENSFKTRICTDTNNCDTDNDKPDEQITCTMPVISDEPETCNEDWSCTAWSECSGAAMTRSCIDLNNCGTNSNKPKVSVSCGVGEEEIDDHQRLLAVTPSSHGGPHLKLYDENFDLYAQFFTYDPSFRNGVNTALGDIDGDGEAEVITGTGPGSAPHVRVFDTKGSLRYQFFAYPEHFRIGLSVAVADVNGDGRDEIIIAPQDKGGPHVRVLTLDTQQNKFVLYKEFFAYPERFRMGVNVAAGDLNNNGLAEIIVAPRNVGGPHIRIYEYNPVTNRLALKNQFFAYDFGFRGGVSLAIGDVDNDGINNIITGAGPTGGPHIRVFDHQGNYKYQFFAASSNFRGGVDVAAFDYDRDGADEVITGAWSRGAPGVKVFDFNLNNKYFSEANFFYAYDPLYTWGIRVAGY